MWQQTFKNKPTHHFWKREKIPAFKLWLKITYIYSFLLTWSQSYQTLISSFFRFLLLSLSVCSIRKYCLYFEAAKLKRKNEKNLRFTKKKVW
jgi:hypothetical protein